MRRYLKLTLAITLLTIFGTLMGWAQIPAGTSVQVRITEKLSSETATIGQQFHGVLAAPITANGRTVFPKGAAITGEVVNNRAVGTVEHAWRTASHAEVHPQRRAHIPGFRANSDG